LGSPHRLCPNTPTEADTAQYTTGFKVFGGYRFTDVSAVELAYHYSAR